MSYTIQQFGSMINDQVRMETYYEALRTHLKPGDVVVDIGAGTGVFSLIACQLGASRVYAIETSSLLQLGHAMAEANGFADRITWISDFSTRITLPERADLIIADLRGQLPLFGKHIASLADAYQRFLKPGGILLPRCDTIYVALGSAANLYKTMVVTPWVTNQYGLDMTAALPLVINMPAAEPEQDLQLVTEPRIWTTLQYGIRTDPNVSGILEWTIDRPVTAHFITAWFDAEIAEGITFTTHPKATRRAVIYGHTLIPLEKALDLQPGETVRLAMSATLIGDRYEFIWRTTVLNADGSRKVSFDQSTLMAVIPSNLLKRSPGYTPKLRSEGEIARFILNAMNGEQSINAIAQALCWQFPNEFANMDEATQKVANFAQHYSA